MKRIIGVLLASFLLASSASAEEYAVVQGDSLYKLSRKFRINIEQIKQENGLNSDFLSIGQKLSIPGRKDEGRQIRETAIVNVHNLNVRQEGNLNAIILNNLKKGTLVELLETGEQWSKIKVGETIGFVYSLHLNGNRETASRSADMLASRVQNIIQPLIGIPYRYGGTTPEGFDCSGFTMYVMGQLGVQLPRVSADQISVGKKVVREDLQVGDLLYFDSLNQGKISHVSIYIGNNKIVHSASKKVEISDLNWYFDNYPYYGARRVLEN